MNIKRNIAIIGCGWLGLPLGNYFYNRGWRVYGSTTDPDKLKHINTHNIHGFILKLGEPTNLDEIETIKNCEVIIFNIPPKQSFGYEEKSMQFLEAIANTHVKHVLFTSSTSVYGDVNGLVDENIRPQPNTEKAKELFRVEQILMNHIHLSCSVLRLAGLVGDQRHPGRFLSGKKNVSNPEAPVNLIHRDDVIEIIYEIVNQCKWGSVYNACSIFHPTRKEFYSKMAQDLEIELPQFESKGGEELKQIVSQKLISDLNYKFKFPDPIEFRF